MTDQLQGSADMTNSAPPIMLEFDFESNLRTDFPPPPSYLEDMPSPILEPSIDIPEASSAPAPALGFPPLALPKAWKKQGLSALRDFCSERGLPRTGTRLELIERLEHVPQ